MENLRRLNKLLKEIDKICLQIKRESLLVMKIIHNRGLEIAKDIREIKPYLEVKIILKMLKDTSMELSKDAETISIELKPFSVAIADGLELENCGCEMLKSIWFGDAFDGYTRYSAMKMLHSDLKNQLDTITLGNIIETVINMDTPEAEERIKMPENKKIKADSEGSE